MTGYLSIKLDNSENDLEILIEDSTYYIYYDCMKNQKINTIKDYENNLKNHIEEILKYSDDAEEAFYYSDAYKNFDKYLNNVQNIILDMPFNEAKEYLKNNMDLLSKKVSFLYDSSLTLNDLDNLKKEFDINNICFKFKDNTSSVSYSDAYKTIEYLENIVNKTIEYNFSPMESVLYFYDKVRARKYTEESIDEEDFVSRDLTSALLGDKIVCAGYSNILKNLMEKRGIKVDNMYIEKKDKSDAHLRVISYIDDKKYNIEGVYCFDPTWDSFTTDCRYLYSYKCFAKTINQMKNLDDSFEEKFYNAFDIDKCNEFLDDLEERKEEACDYSLCDDNDIRFTINKLSNLIYGKDAFLNPVFYKLPFFGKKFDEDEIFNIVDDICTYCTKEIDGKKYLQMLCNVRKHEYFEEPSKYPYSIKEICIAVILSRWNIDSNQDKLLRCIFNNLEDIKNFKYDKTKNYNRAYQYLMENNIDREIEGIKLARTLKEVQNKRVR